MQEEMPASFSDILANTPCWFPQRWIEMLSQTNINDPWSHSRIRFRALWYVQVHPRLTQEKGLIHPLLLHSPKAFINESSPEARIRHGQQKLWSSKFLTCDGLRLNRPRSFRCLVFGARGYLSHLQEVASVNLCVSSHCRATSTFISALTLSCAEDEGIRNTSEVGSLDAFASNLPFSSRLISHPAYD